MGRKIGTLGLINYRRHPENPNYIVFGFNSAEEAAIFERELGKTKTSFEKDEEVTKDGTIYLYAVSESSMDEANRANGTVRETFKDPLLKNKWLRYSLLLFIGTLLVIALIGYVKNPDKVQKQMERERIDSTNFTQ